MAYGVHLLYEPLSIIDFQKGNVRYGGPVPVPRPPGDFPYTDFARGRDLDLFYTNIWGRSYENGH